MSTTANPIVVGVDGTPASNSALRWAMDEAVVRGCTLHVVNAWNYEPMADWRENTVQQAEAESEALIDESVRAASEGRAELPEIVRRSLRGYAAEVLEKASEGAALLVVASHTGHWMRQIVLGSTSMHVVRHAHTPVVVIPVTDRESAEATR
ncbi:universal stress protein [Lentzea aerocolonigenes]|uniref:universal stress protein n=1 Tax=Lentzea aerocolonigenes TaxID=68170 RepID=UPI00068CC421|nr:universal stress protein [Lentzea aerocolonigenes]MCP2247259.1 Nucleotide-binding universal stress protein, UspA family [Lentzea aerocolonigenes]